MFTTMTHVSLYTAATTGILLAIALRRNPLEPAWAFLRQLVTSRIVFLHVLALISILALNKVELVLESRMSYPVDFTPYLHQLEGNVVYWIQSLFRHDLLTGLLSYFYVAVFPAMLAASIGIYVYQRNLRLFYALCYAMMFNYMVAIPFYLFVPVTEVWAYVPKVQFLMLDVFPTFETEYRALSGLDNCFPSLHTSISVTLAVIASRSGNDFWRRFCLVSAVIIIFSIFYLGIHWVSDMLAGLVLGTAAARAGLYISDSRAASSRQKLPLQQTKGMY